MPEEPSVKLAQKASWPKLLNPLGPAVAIARAGSEDLRH